jgi:hypothetical protein
MKSFGLKSLALSGGGASTISTVGTGGDYATVSAAISAGKYNLILISDVTEISDIGISENTNINLNGNTLNLGSNKIARPSLKKLTIHNGGLTVKLTSSGSSILSRVESPEYTILNKIHFTNNTTVALCPIIDNHAVISECLINLPNVSSGGFGGVSGGSGLNLLVSDCHFIGGGTACQNGIQSYSISNNLLFTGTFKTNDYIAILRGGVHANIIINTSAGNRIRVGRCVNLQDITGAYAVYCEESISDSLIAGLGGAAPVPDHVRVSNVNFITPAKAVFNNNKMIMVNCRFSDSVDVNGDDNKISNCNIGTVTSGTKTITVNATANNTIITNCSTEAAISDSGTGTIKVNNVLF